MVQVDLDIRVAASKKDDKTYLYAMLGSTDSEDLVRRTFSSTNSEIEIDIWLEEVTLRLKEKLMGW